ncbi:MAG: hypothetical protein H0X17_11120 [Deltaproteobacteria bacterium]|nr:hypothetical protein [Deltaproteobacteria bacterium]
MADLVLRLRVDPATGRREVVVDYHSDSDALPIEHEDEHRRLAAKVVEGGLDGPGVAISREDEAPVTGGPVSSDDAIREATKSSG